MTTHPSHDNAEVLDDAWESLTKGNLTNDEEAVLRALAEENAADAANLEAYAPLDETFRARVTDRLGMKLTADRRARARHRLVGAMSFAAAAALLLLWLPAGSNGVPRYVLSVQGGDAETRGSNTPSASDDIRVSQDSVLTLVAQPEQRLDTKPTAALFVLSEGRAVRLRTHVEVADSGAVRLRVPGALLPFPEQRTLTLALVISGADISAEEAKNLVAERDPRALVARLVRSVQ